MTTLNDVEKKLSVNPLMPGGNKKVTRTWETFG